MRFKPNDICIVDINNNLNLKEYHICKVRIIKRVGWGRYLVTPISPIVYPITKNSFVAKSFVINKKWLVKSSIEEKVVIRTPLDCPTITKDDLAAMKIAIEVMEYTLYPYTDTLKGLYVKLNYYSQFSKKTEL